MSEPADFTMDAPLASVDALLERLDDDIAEDDQVQTLAARALEDASTEVRHYGLSGWTASNCPPMARKIALSAAKRYMDNRMGLSQSRAGDETLSWETPGAGNPERGSVYLTEREQKILARLSRGETFASVGGFAYSDRPAHEPETLYVPSANGGAQIPWANSEDWA